jgi:hypothetical protein
MGLCILLRVLSRSVSKTVLRNKCSRCFYFILFIATCFGLYDGHPQVNCTKYENKLLFLQRIRCVYYSLARLSHIIILNNGSVVEIEIAISVHILYYSPEDGHQIGRNMLR